MTMRVHSVGRWGRRMLLPFAALIVGTRATMAQDRAGNEARLTSREPSFYLVRRGRNGEAPVRIDARNVAVLRRRVSLDVRAMPIGQVLAAMTRETGLHFSYSPELVPSERHITIHVDQLSLVAALTEVLLDTGLDVELTGDNQASLVPRRENEWAAVHRQAGILTGHVTERTSNGPIASAQVTVVGTGLSRYTDDKGQYRIVDVPAGEHQIMVRRLGFEVMSRKIQVGDGETATMDFSMARVATALTEVVTTATGERSRVEVGNSIGTIRADSVVATALIRNMSDLLTARVPGLIVGNLGGLVGQGSLIRIRGTASLNLNNDPIIIMDGIRLQPASNAGLATQVGGGGSGVSWGGNTPTRLDDIDPNIIESIDVLRGPSASSLYGTDAAAGVIVIKTKKGVAGSLRFNVLADEGVSRQTDPLPKQLVAYGHAEDGTPIETCVLVGKGIQQNVTDHTCVQDSVVAYNTLNLPGYELYGPGWARNLSATLSGGSEQVREFLSLRYSDATGTSLLPPNEGRRIVRMWQEAPPSWMQHPNTESNITMTSRTDTRALKNLDLSFNASGIYRNTLTGGPGGVYSDNNVLSSLFNPGMGRELYDTLIYLPAESMRGKTSSLIRRGVVTANATYTPLSWLIVHGTIGGDYTQNAFQSLTRASDCTVELNPSGCPSSHGSTQYQTFVTTADVGGQATWQPSNGLSFRTSIGEQISRTTNYQMGISSGSGTSLAFGTELLSPTPVTTTTGTQIYSGLESRDESATAGWYLEETASLAERLFLTAAFRQDVASAFGSLVNAKAPVYPKYSLSWVASDEPFFPKTAWISSFRLRTAYGHSGQEARQTQVFKNFSTSTDFVDGVQQGGIRLTSIGNPTLRPERTAELEGGFDLSLLRDERLHLEVTTYRKISRDALASGVLAPSIIFGSQFQNLGSVENRGWEVSAAAKILDMRIIGYQLTINASSNTNRLVSGPTGDGNTVALRAGYSGQYVGYPLQSVFGTPFAGYTDFNHDGILTFNEIQQSPQLKFLGSSIPGSELTYVNALQLWGGAVQVNATLDQINGKATSGNGAQGNYVGTFGGNRRAVTDGVLTIAQQAAILEQVAAGNGSLGLAGIEKANTLRFSELSVTGVVPGRLATRVLRAHTASLTLAGRNLGVWSNGSRPDPGIVPNTFAGNSSNYFGQSAYISEPRNWTLRINLGY